jgi:hypothetical protein
MYATFEGFEIAMTKEQAQDCSHPGSCNADVLDVSQAIKRPEGCTPERLRRALKEYGAWGEDALSNDAENWQRIVWIAAGDISDGQGYED